MYSDVLNTQFNMDDYHLYAFHEDFFAIDTPFLEGPQVLPVHEVEMDDFIVGMGPNHNSLAQDFPTAIFQ